MCTNKREVEGLIDRLDAIQTNMQEKALKKDASIIMDVFELDEIVNELKVVVYE